MYILYINLVLTLKLTADNKIDNLDHAVGWKDGGLSGGWGHGWFREAYIR